MKLITFAVPCYNSAAYMRHCADTLLTGGDQVEIILVDDGSADETGAIADEYAQRYPNIVRAIHQPNGGHGEGVNQGLRNAQGMYYKVVDSDDWLNEDALQRVLTKLRELSQGEEPLDMMVCNYVYEHVAEGISKVVRYTDVFPEGKVFTWADLGHWKPSEYLLMHSVIYRTELLRGMGLQLPKHTFYVDNIYAYVPFPKCRSLYYLDVDVYRYFIGREDQSVNDKVLTSRVDHYWRVARVMMHAYHVYQDVDSVKLRSYMMNYFTIIMAICSVFSKKSDRPDAMDELQALWDELRSYDPRMYRRARHGVVGLATNLPGTVGRALTLAGYRAAQKLVKFN